MSRCRLGLPDDPKLPAKSFDRIFLVHMYHEVTSPYAFLWHLREGLKDGGEVIVVDADRPTRHHGIPPDLLKCEFAAVGLDQVRIQPLAGSDGYFAAFVARRPAARAGCDPRLPSSRSGLSDRPRAGPSGGSCGIPTRRR